jgi:N-methylhydantoinase B
VVIGALATALPGQVFACPYGTLGNVVLSGLDEATGRYYIAFTFWGGGYGGSPELDGLTNGSTSISVARTPPMEILEQGAPVLVEFYGLRENSGGAGTHRGGFGVEAHVRLRRGQAVVSTLMDHAKLPPFGVYDGNPGARAEIVFEEQGQQRRPAHLKDDGRRIVAGDKIIVRTPGGGGWGNPLARPAAMVERDFRCGYITTADALGDYAVVLDSRTLAVDEQQTAALRSRVALSAGHRD